VHEERRNSTIHRSLQWVRASGGTTNSRAGGRRQGLHQRHHAGGRRARRRTRGWAVRVEPMTSMLKAAATKRLTLIHDVLLSTFAFNFNLHRFNEDVAQRLLADGASHPDADNEGSQVGTGKLCSPRHRMWFRTRVNNALDDAACNICPGAQCVGRCGRRHLRGPILRARGAQRMMRTGANTPHSNEHRNTKN
jgi:hypothetical protein